MNKKLVYFFLLTAFSSCQFFDFGKKENTRKNPIASINNNYLYSKDIESLIPKNISKNDSILIVKSIINNWAVQELLKQKAEENLTLQENETYNKLVQDYKESLLINGYKERLIQQQLDTVISEDEIGEYYDANKVNFRLNEELIKIKYLHFGNNLLDQKEIIKHFKSDKEEDLIALENQELNFKAINLNDSTWIKLEDVLLKIPKFKEEPREYLLKKTKYIQKKDSLGLYLVAVKDVLKRNDIAPINYITPTIKQLILHKRKLELIRDIEKTLLNDAIQNKNFKEY
ncbi:hypothetical protein KCTC32516_02173 [Polaribacter huanghezhanensis]|uniref:hypothetical protein n=1 Tax=Polaribacter huanghezhanensis TaxID=1354726 RepID=UPI00264A22DF|nr:hypothetical protein [Polaribacter huanghezhanensis]WKD86795.1 hypothetical protein KCTC32516_02173 [Polaribacter huanghezhanensis]